ncbi:RNA-binding protein Rsf1 [Anopheles merus]|uniref:RRM domain-containing protein n=1 Tax=Anopheles merus TaxID=30066 RepID=A0A182V0Z9_ANOME|nr:RNA-binding protein Rsf1 [Anopheles merus]XP_041776221.1 RNA-binding protein Rsf1 [Anopheles merus]
MGDSKGTRVYVGNLTDKVKKEDLEGEFTKYGKLNSVWVAFNPPGFAFIEFENKEEAETACDNLNGQDILGSKLRVEISKGRRNPRGASRGFRGPPGRNGGSGGGSIGGSGGGSSFRNGSRGGFRDGGGSSYRSGSSGGGGSSFRGGSRSSGRFDGGYGSSGGGGGRSSGYSRDGGRDGGYGSSGGSFGGGGGYGGGRSSGGGGGGGGGGRFRSRSPVGGRGRY